MTGVQTCALPIWLSDTLHRPRGQALVPGQPRLHRVGGEDPGDEAHRRARVPAVEVSSRGPKRHSTLSLEGDRGWSRFTLVRRGTLTLCCCRRLRSPSLECSSTSLGCDRRQDLGGRPDVERQRQPSQLASTLGRGPEDEPAVRDGLVAGDSNLPAHGSAGSHRDAHAAPSGEPERLEPPLAQGALGVVRAPGRDGQVNGSSAALGRVHDLQVLDVHARLAHGRR